MALLCYCVFERNPAIKLPSRGVSGLPLAALGEGPVVCLASPAPDFPRTGDTTVSCAVEFHRVIEQIFQQTQVIPFRFPSFMKAEPEIQQYLRQHSSAYLHNLRRLSGAVQMEVRIGAEKLANGSARTGTEYLQNKQAKIYQLESLAQRIREQVQLLSGAWQQKPAADGLRGYALVDRNAADAFAQQVRTLPLVDGLTLRVSGPWPPTQFLVDL
jgi:hypothetical protein